MNNSSTLRSFHNISLKIKDDHVSSDRRNGAAKKNVLEGYITMTFAVTKHPRRDTTAISAGVPFRFFFFMRYFYFGLRRRPHADPGMQRDFLRLFMETREVCESVSRGSKERKVVKRAEGRAGGGK